MRPNDASIREDKVRMANVLAKPGTPSRRMCPSDNRPINRASVRCDCPTITFDMPSLSKVMKPDCASMREFRARISTFSTIGKLDFLILSCEVSTFRPKSVYKLCKMSCTNSMKNNFQSLLTNFFCKMTRDITPK